MARLPYASLSSEPIQPLVERITKERGSVLHLYQMLLHSPPVAEGWLNYLTAIRQKCSLNGALRELVIVRVAIINGADYEAAQHVPIALKEGVTQAQIDALSDWQASDQFSEKEKRVLALTDEMTRNVQVDKATIDNLKAHFDERELVELVATVASYNMVSRFLEALGIHIDDERSPA
ncbi:MAG: carboxymuconolactone decarboxylase family protein [Pollutimonas bauzanensis]|uniref:Alkylhydroperoxidase AhpD family core domain-containing protein n=1 Tax=Pollutimonas bauzanensis TaxID=658167 RepID=A0A1M5UUM7_9BURK|nr:carboxymuconolactone decarboxylase family protein [Pollutimonas bauzanensis]SHH66538.1 alkylhydroperoxidase AhpD family core domain-containing protein [Pollutimonas bauzanensis]